MTVGGGNAAGVFDPTSLKKVIADMSHVSASYSGIVFDVEIN
jgi:hypothetical protein